jgi:hypothetical protein
MKSAGNAVTSTQAAKAEQTNDSPSATVVQGTVVQGTVTTVGNPAAAEQMSLDAVAQVI